MTDQCNFPEAARHNAAIQVAQGTQPLADGLVELLTLSRSQSRELGLRGRKLVEQDYTWESVAKRMIAVYRWILNGGSAPADVRFA
jgi:poly(glycerol-phosphate) alpha-glucosyltransferase